MSQFSHRLVGLRRDRGFTLATLGARAGLHPTQVSRLERGLAPTIEAIGKLAQALDVPAVELADAAIADLVAIERVDAR